MNKGDENNTNEDGTLESRFYVDAKTMETKLNSISPSMCMAKWKQVTLNLTTGHTNSCYHPAPHKIPVELLKNNPSALHNTPYKIERRQEMLDGIRHPECSYCWNIEKDGNLSDRAYRSGESWAAEGLAKSMYDIETPIPSYVEVNFNSACNLKCSYCSPQYSTSWMKETKEHGAYPTVVPYNELKHFTGERMPIPHKEYNPYVEAFWKWWPTLYPELKHFRMTGGEPLMDRNTYKVFDYVLANPKKDLHLDVTSNFSVEPKFFDKYMSYVTKLCEGDKIEHFMQYVSVDTYGDQAEYIRNGLDFNRLIENVHRFLTDAPGKNSITFIITMNMLSIPNLDTLLNEILLLRDKYSKTYQRIWFDTPLLRQPAWQSIELSPLSLRSKLNDVKLWMQTELETADDPFHGFKDYEVQRIQRDLDWMNCNPLKRQEKLDRMADFYRFFKEHDERRGTDFLATFPMLESFWDQCKMEAAKDV